MSKVTTGKKGNTWVVSGGDNIAKIAEDVYGNQRMMAEIIRLNGGVSTIRPGMVLQLPAPKANEDIYISNDWAANMGMMTTDQLKAFYAANPNAAATPAYNAAGGGWANAAANPLGTINTAASSATSNPFYTPPVSATVNTSATYKKADAWYNDTQPAAVNMIPTQYQKMITGTQTSPAASYQKADAWYNDITQKASARYNEPAVNDNIKQYGPYTQGGPYNYHVDYSKIWPELPQAPAPTSPVSSSGYLRGYPPQTGSSPYPAGTSNQTLGQGLGAVGNTLTGRAPTGAQQKTTTPITVPVKNTPQQVYAALSNLPNFVPTAQMKQMFSTPAGVNTAIMIAPYVDQAIKNLDFAMSTGAMLSMDNARLLISAGVVDATDKDATNYLYSLVSGKLMSSPAGTGTTAGSTSSTNGTGKWEPYNLGPNGRMPVQMYSKPKRKGSNSGSGSSYSTNAQSLASYAGSSYGTNIGPSLGLMNWRINI